MDKAIVSDDAHAFIKELVELGGVRYVDKDLIIHNASDDTPVGVSTGTPPKRRPVAVFKQGMPVGNYVVLNPFTDIMGNSPERALFTNWMCAFPGAIIRHVISSMIKLGISKESTGYKANKYISKWVEKMDDKLVDEVNRINTRDWAVIFYDKSKHVAQLQTNVGTKDLMDNFRTKIRKNSWPILVDMLKTILQVPNNKKVESLSYTSKLTSIPKVDAILNLLIEVLKRMETPIKEFTDIKIPTDDLAEHIKHLEAYREATKWFASATVSAEAEQSATDTAVPPWSQPPIINPSAPAATQTSGLERAMEIAHLSPVGIIQNPNYGQGQMVPVLGGAVAPYMVQPDMARSMEIAALRPW